MKVSVIVPVRNGERYVTRCIDSILPQMARDMELIVVDDASPDGTPALLRKTYGTDPRVLLVCCTEHRGPAAARNAGIRLSRGEWIAFCDSDDEWAPQNLQRLLAHVQEHPEQKIVFASCRSVLDQETSRTKQLAAYAEKDLFHLRAAMIRRSVFTQVGLLDENLRVGEDREWLVRVKNCGIWGDLLEEPLYIRHIRDDGLSAEASETGRKERILDAFMRGIRRTLYKETPDCDMSILIPVYNAEKYVEEAIRSCRCESRSFELVLVEDGSSDRSVDVLFRMMREGEFPAPATVVMRAHKGQAASRNDAFHLARGSHILYLDADDCFVPGGPDRMMDAAQGQDVMLVSALCRDFISPDLTEEDASVLKIESEPYRRMLAGCMLADRRLYERIGLFDESLPSSETAQWVLRVRDAGVMALELDDVVLSRRYHNTNFGRVSRQTQMSSYMAMIRSRLKKG